MSRKEYETISQWLDRKRREQKQETRTKERLDNLELYLDIMGVLFMVFLVLLLL